MGGGKRGGGKREKLKLRNVMEYFANEKMQRGGSQQIQGGNRDYRVWEAGGLNLPVPPRLVSAVSELS